MTAFITGATGFLGREVVRSLFQADQDARLVALIRAKDEADLARRRERLVQDLPEHQRERLQALRGDIERPRLGLSEYEHAALVERVDRVLHVAATTNFDHSLEEARRINVGGTESSIKLCQAVRKRGASGRLDYVGTAYVAGDRTDLCMEEELSRGQGFRNTYEQSKFEAETLCRRAREELPVAIHRPSIIVGDSRTGQTTSYKTIYWPMKVLVRFYGMSRAFLPRLVRLPVNPACVLDIVPVNFVAESVTKLYLSPKSVGQCFHLAAGDRAATIGELVAMACDHFGVARLGFIDPEGPLRHVNRAAGPVLSRAAPRLYKNGALMAAYTRRNPRFDTTAAIAAGLSPPTVEEYFPKLLSFAYGTDFGRVGP